MVILSADAADGAMASTLEDVLHDTVGDGGPFFVMLLRLTAATQFADAMELMMLPFLAKLFPCQHSNGRNIGLEQDLLSTVVFIGMGVGALTMGYVSDIYGRRKGVLLATFLVGCFGALSAISADFYILCGMRFFVGIGVGGSNAALSLYSEFIPVNSRGKGLITFLTFFSVGSVLEVGCAYIAFLYIPQNLSMSALLLLSSLPSIALFVLVWKYLPESPRFLLKQGRVSECAAVLFAAAVVNSHNPHISLAKIEGNLTALLSNNGSPHAHDRVSGSVQHGQREMINEAGDSPLLAPLMEDDAKETASSDNCFDSGDEDNALLNENMDKKPLYSIGLVQRNHAAVIKTMQIADREDMGWGILCRLTNAKTTATLCALFFLMALLYYGLVLLTVELADGGPSNGSTGACTVTTDGFGYILISNFAELPGLAVAFFLLDSMGRKRTIALFSAVTGVTCVCLLFTTTKSRSTDSSFGAYWFRTVIMFIARGAALGFNQSLWVYTSEIYSTPIRTRGIGFCTFFARAGSLLSPVTVGEMYAFSPLASIVVLASSAFISSLLALALPVETAEMELS